MWPEIRAGVARAARMWLELHTATLSALVQPGRRGAGARRLVLCLAVDLVLLVGLAAIAALLLSPVIGG
jgi:hypothetical protein